METSADVVTATAVLEHERRFVISLNDLSSSEPRHFWIDQKREVVVLPTSEGFSVFASICPHMGARLQPDPEGKSLSCPWHGLKFDTSTCQSNHERFTRVKKYRTSIENNELIIWG